MNYRRYFGILLWIFFFFAGVVFNAGAQQNPVSKTKKCGDGICDSFEQANPEVCPQDCRLEETKHNNNSVFDTSACAGGSPFGFHPGNANKYSYLKDLNVGWSREGMYVIWDWVDQQRNGHYNFTQAKAPAKNKSPQSEITINYDAEWFSVPSNVNIVANVCPFRTGGEFNNQKEHEIYQDFVKALVERYDGDSDLGCSLDSPDCYNPGDGQYPRQEVIAIFQKNPVKYWQVCNQLFDTCKTDCKADYAASFALAQEKTYKGVKEADESAAVLIAGDSAKDLYPAVFQQLNGKYIDIVDYHRFMPHNRYNPQKDFDYLKESLRNSGFDIGKLRFWITESGTYSGDPVAHGKGKDLPYQNERQQAIGLFKIYISAITYGIEKVFWAWNIIEGFHYDCGIFDYTGLVYDGNINRQGKPYCEGDLYDQGRGVKKLAYYTYKFMVEKLEGSDWSNSKVIRETDNVFVYKFIKKENGEPVWVVWWDWWLEPDKKETEVSFNLADNTDEFIITDAVAGFESGKETAGDNYPHCFKTKVVKAGGNILKISLTDIPVYIEIKK